MFNNNSVSISVSDDEPDELGRNRGRVRRKRKKHGYRVNDELASRVFRFLVKYWTLLIFLPAAGLLLFEISRLGSKSSMVVNTELRERPVSLDSDLSVKKKTSLEKVLKGNLNRLDPTTRVVNGVRQRKLVISFWYFC